MEARSNSHFAPGDMARCSDKKVDFCCPVDGALERSRWANVQTGCTNQQKPLFGQQMMVANLQLM